MDDYESIKEELQALPKGYISNKTINGKVRHYLQWAENGKVKSKYIRDAEYEDVKAGIARRKELSWMLREQEFTYRTSASKPSYGFNVLTGEALDRIVAEPLKLEVRDCFPNIEAFLYGPQTSRIMVVYGLRRTGKTTLLFQAIGRMDRETRKKAFYVKAQKGQTMSGLIKTLEALFRDGYRYAFIDEITFIEDFVDTAAVLPDIYAAMGMKIVISGTDSLGLWLAGKNELYDRTYTIHTTWISFAEHARLLHTSDVDDYIRFGGTLRAGEYDFDDPELRDESISFRDDESTRRYIDSAICFNIQHSLKCYESGTRFMHLQELYDAGELTNAINRIIEDMNHRFVLSVLQDDFRSSDFSLAEKNLLKERDASLRTELTPAHVAEIREYLKALDLIETVPVRYAYGAGSETETVYVTQPGMRYCQAEALVWSLKKDELFAELSEAEKDYVIGKILEGVKGRMLEEIVLTETRRTLDSRKYDVFKYQFVGGEIDMVIYDRTENDCRLYEIKHTDTALKEQCRHLLNDQECERIQKSFGCIVGKTVLYRGTELHSDWDIAYRSAAEFLEALPAGRS